MKFKKLLFILGAALTFSLASCGSNATSETSLTTTTTTTQSTEQITQVDYLSFVGQNKIRVDILDNVGANFNYGNAAVVSTNQMDINSNSYLAFSGTITADSVNFIFIVESGNSNNFQSTFSVHGGIDNEYVETFLSRASLKSLFNNAYKVYIAISTGEVKWTKNLNAQLDAKIRTYII
ncbi:MAG: hypothetical protein IKP77_00035 [Acholeplasmatales bacterium]|nr:hypothetical protein [Acholeplasmatales bacterium]